MSATAIQAQGLGKRYRIGSAQRSSTLREALTTGTAAALRSAKARMVDGRAETRDLWALRDATFTVGPGESVAIIGSNGSGKSTLLKIISRIISPTTGSARIRGRVGALLEVGTGFHPELTGRDNIFLNGAVLGMTANDIRKRFDQIVEFSGVEEFLGMPIKRYSSGMTMRLAFAVAAHLEPDVLIVDEVLAVGDAEFQRKCLGRMDEISKGGCTVLFVSHNLSAVQRLCSRALLLEDGRVLDDGPTAEVVSRYLQESSIQAEGNVWVELAGDDVAAARKKPQFSALRYLDPERPSARGPRSTGPLSIDIRIDSPRQERAVLAVDISHELAGKLVNADSWTKSHQLIDLPMGASTWNFAIESLHLEPGRYLVDLWLADSLQRAFDHRPMAVQMNVLTADGLPADPGVPSQQHGLVTCNFRLSRADRDVDSRNGG